MGSKTNLKIHLILVVKYRKKLLKLINIKPILLDIVEEGCYSIGIMEVDQDHIHFIISYPPVLSVSMIVRDLKQKSTNRIWKIYNSLLTKYFWKEKTFWSDGYFATSIGEVSSETVRKYIEKQG